MRPVGWVLGGGKRGPLAGLFGPKAGWELTVEGLGRMRIGIPGQPCWAFISQVECLLGLVQADCIFGPMCTVFAADARAPNGGRH